MSIHRKFISVKVGESQLRERNWGISILLSMGEFLASSQDFQTLLDGALEKILEFFHLGAGRIYLLEEGGESLYLAACRGMDAKGFERVKVSEGFTGKALRTCSFIAQHVTELEDEKRRDALLSKGFKVIICVPLIAMKQEVVGVMNLASSSLIELDDASIDLLIAMGNQMALAANNARLHGDLKKKIEELEEQKNAIEFFAYSISHDLKSPAIGIYGLARRLENKYGPILDETGRTYCAQILKASQQVHRLVDRINAYIMARESAYSFETVDFLELCEDLRQEFSQVLENKSLSWIVPAGEIFVVADKVSLKRVLRNLVDNAIKYGGPGLTEVRVGYEDGGTHHIISVFDDGVALKVEDSPSLFLPFHRHKTSKGSEGTGLGLATVREIAEKHGGRAWIESGKERGTTFFISLAKNIHLGQEHVSKGLPT